MKETTEAFEAGFKAVDTIIDVRSDGKINEQDIPKLLNLIFPIIAGIKDLTFAQEAKAATPATIDAAFLKASKQFTVAGPDFAAGFTGAVKGYYYTYWLAVRQGHATGVAEGRAQILAEIKAKGLTAVLAAQTE